MNELERLELSKELHFALKERRYINQRLGDYKSIDDIQNPILKNMYMNLGTHLEKVEEKINGINQQFTDANTEPFVNPFGENPNQ